MIIFWCHILSAATGVAVAGVLVAMLILFPDHFRKWERVGMGLVGGTLILRVGPVMAFPETTPFSDWSPAVMAIGMLLMTGGRLVRLIRHDRVNQRAVDSAEAHLSSRGKL